MHGYKKGGKFIPTQRNKAYKSSLSTSDVTGYNVKLKKKEKIQNPKHVTLKNGRHAIKGVGSDGTPIFRFVASNTKA